VIFGLVPAVRGSRVDLTDSLKQGARGSAAGIGRGMRLGSQQLLVVGETALAVVLLVGAGLYVRSLQKQLDVSLGFDPKNVLRAWFVLPQAYTPEQRLQLVDQLRARLSAVPSVNAVTLDSDLPLAGGTNAAMMHLPEANQTVRFYRHSIDTAFFRTIGAHLVAGRAFGAEDRTGSPAVVIVNESMVRRFWGDKSPIGKTLRLGNETGPEVTIVGVVADIRQRDLTTTLVTSEPDVYFPLAQRPSANIQLAIRSTLPAENLAASVRRELATLDPTIPLFAVRPLEQLLDQQTASGRFASIVLAVFGAAALVLTAVGLYGVLAFLVSLRSREIGIRMALGATQGRVLGGVIGQGIRLVVTGSVIGSIAAALLVGWISSQLFGIRAHDPIVFVGVPFVLIAVASAASWLPARRAARVDPQIALRSE
jgi:predicted permease